MLFTLFALVVLLLASLPTALVIRNLALFARAPQAPSLAASASLAIQALASAQASALDTASATATVDIAQAGSPLGSPAARRVSVLIPARNEELGIAAAVSSIAANTWRELEIIVMDDHSTDQTAAIVQSLAKNDPRIRLVSSPELPPGWNGKQHACWRAAQLAQGELLLFMDADVRLQPAAIERYVAQFDLGHAKLLSGFPNQELGTLSESMLIPLMYVVLLGYLPLDQMRTSVKPGFGAGCGQLFLAEREAYFACAGHQAIAGSRHDGLKLPRAFRTAGHMTDLFDASDIATVRMYRGWREVTRGLLKNATEGIANPNLIVLFSVLLIGGFTAPVLSFAHALFYGWTALPTILLGLATLLSFLPRALIARRLGHSSLAVILNPLAILVFVMLQWIALVRQATGLGTVAWRGRT